MPTFSSAAKQLIDYFKHDIWLLDTSVFSKPKAVTVHAMRIFVLAIRGFVVDKGALRASALTFYCLLSVVPVVAMAFGIAQGFGFEQKLENQLYLRLAGQEEVVEKIIAFSRSLLENTKGGIVAGFGVLVLFWSVVKVLGHIEKALNEIWKVKARTFVRRFTDYLAVMLVSPILLIVSSSITVYISTQVTAAAKKLALLRAAGPLIYLLLKMIPYGLIWLLFVLIYMVMPNTRVRFQSALIASIVAGTIYQLSQGFYINAQLVVANHNAVYGSFAALPLFLIWLQISWMIVLLGGQIAHAHQFAEKQIAGPGFEKTSMATEKKLGLCVLRSILLAFKEGRHPPDAADLAQGLRLPYQMVEKSLAHLVSAGMVSIVVDERRQENAYQPARAIENYTVASFLESWDKQGREENPAVETRDSEAAKMSEAIRDLYLECSKSKANRKLIEL